MTEGVKVEAHRRHTQSYVRWLLRPPECGPQLPPQLRPPQCKCPCMCTHQQNPCTGPRANHGHYPSRNQCSSVNTQPASLISSTVSISIGDSHSCCLRQCTCSGLYFCDGNGVSACPCRSGGTCMHRNRYNRQGRGCQTK
jgi:hypothetical protein